MRKLFEYGGIAASVVLIAFGAGSVGIGAWGINNVRDNLKLEQISGTPDMTPSAIKAEGQKAGLTNVSYPTCNIAGQAVDTGSKARCFASYMRIHALEATGGQTYSQMGRFLDKNGKATSDEALAAKGPTGQPVENGLRNLWVTETALTTALNTAFFAERVGVFGMVMGIALLLTGIGFLILTLGGALRRREVVAKEAVRNPVVATG
ncbi:MAG TPA: hypothetical protein VK488_11820 [Gaiellaceae bacterium]|nr:hypothetical protein [Gaiellaceae bacterium]